MRAVATYMGMVMERLFAPLFRKVKHAATCGSRFAAGAGEPDFKTPKTADGTRSVPATFGRSSLHIR
jgi:hypothetical protein